jgi:hypothetical protein
MKPYTKGLTSSGNVCKKTFMDILKIDIPALSLHPIKFPISPDTKPEFVPICMVLLANIRIVNVSQTIVLIKGDQKTTIPNRDVAWHFIIPFFKGYLKKR